MLLDKEQLLKEVLIRTSRSGGKGGQNVNKVSTKVELVYNIEESLLFTEDQKKLLIQKMSSRLDNDNCLHVVSQETRSQLLNKQLALEKIFQLLVNALKVDRKRIATKTPKAVKVRRSEAKKTTSLKKESRRKPRLD